MSTPQENTNAAIASIAIGNKPLDALLSKEWLLTNNRGGYASSTIIGCNTRRYHGLLIGSPNPPANRIMALSNCLETVIIHGETFNLSIFEFKDKLAPDGFIHIRQFRRDIGVHFDYELGKLKLTKSVYLLHDADTVALVYNFTNVEEKVEFVLRPFVGLRNFHELQKSHATLCTTNLGDSLIVHHNIPESCELFLNCPAANFQKDEQWWFNFAYRNDRQRGQDFTEDLWTPGVFSCDINSPTKIVFRASLKQIENFELQNAIDDLQKHQNNTLIAAKTAKHNIPYETLCLAADQFIVNRVTNDEPRATILAGFPWFADWGRDAFIALPGLLLSTERFDDAKSALTTFAQAADDGLIPNRFDDNSGTAYFNSVDTSLWFINAAFQYLNATDDCGTFHQQLLPTILDIINSYQQGTKFGIRADSDGLITAGNDQTQLTWMDAKYNGVAITPRYGKAVEVNALWYNALRQLSVVNCQSPIDVDKVKASFCKLFWNETAGYLNDCILPNGSADTTLRPNQIFAVSLPFSPLTGRQQKMVVDVVQKNLLTPYGLRTLPVTDPRYKGKYIGPQQQRDEAYHQGTIWPYLIGPFVEAYLKVNKFSSESKAKAAEFIEPLMQHLTEDGCLGSISEIFDGNAPHKPRGCFAQAWSVAELIRVYRLINK